jgi:tetratricopeptide (TPR) repeat protein
MSSSTATQANSLNKNTMSSSTVSQAIFLNNQGVNFLESGSFKEAAQSFSRGLTIAKIALEESNDDTETSSDACPTGRFHQAVMKPLHLSNKFEDQMTDDQPFVFTRPILISENSDEEVSSSYFISLSFMQLYNLALCHHLYALSSEDNSQKKLQKALSLYELAYTLQRTDDTKATVLQNMAIVNNLGHIHAALQNFECSMQCFDNLLSTIMLVKDSGEQVEQMDGFLSNVMNLMNNTSCITLAAAA